MTFSGASESDQESIISMSTAGSDHMEEEEINESLLDDNEEESADGAEKDKEMETSTTGKDESTKEVAHNAGSVGSLATSFMLNVTVGSNDVFAQPKIDSCATSRKKWVRVRISTCRATWGSQGSMRWLGQRGATGWLQRHFLV